MMHQGHEHCNSPMKTEQQVNRKHSHSFGKIVELSEVMQSSLGILCQKTLQHNGDVGRGGEILL